MKGGLRSSQRLSRASQPPIVPTVSNQHRVVASTKVIAGLTLFSRVLGLARECTYAHFFGTGELLSAFRIAFMIPNLSRRLFGEGALSAAFIPVFTRALRDGDPQHARRLAGGTLTLLVTLLIGMVIIVEVCLLMANALHPGLTLRLTAIMLPFMAFICVAAFLGGILNVLGRFAAPAAAPMLLNAFVIVTILTGAYWVGLSRRHLIYAACGAVLLAGAAQVGLQLLSLREARFRPTLNRDWSHPRIREVAGLMGPMMLGLSAVQINTMLDMLIAKFFVPDGQGPAVLGYAHFMYQLPLGVFGIALATAIFPVLASQAAAGDMQGVTRTVERGARLSFFVSLPATVGMILIAKPLVAALFERGSFDVDGTGRVSRTLICYTLGLCAYSFQHILVRAFYSLKEHKTPVRVAAAVVLVNLVLNLILVKRLGEAGVALATAISATLQVVWLAAVLHRRLPLSDWRSLVVSASKTVVCAAVMGACVWLVVGDASPLGASSWSALVKVVVAVPVGCAVVGLTGRLLAVPEVIDLLRRDR